MPPVPAGTAAATSARPGPLVGFCVAAVAGMAGSLAVVTGDPIRNDKWLILAKLALWSLAWGAGVVCAFRLPRRIAVPAVFAVAVALRLAALAGEPVTSDDLYRYAWDGRVQSAGVDPYHYAPEEGPLQELREGWLWPDKETCARLFRPDGCTRINRPSVHTIYPPVAEAWFTVVYKVAGIGARHKAWQVAGLAGDVALVALLPLALRAWGRDERWTALYALSPVPVLEVVNNGHVDGLAALLVVAALLCTARRRPVWAGALLGAATLVKLYPALLGLALVVAVADRRRDWVLKLAGAAAAVVGLAYAPHVAVVGLRVIGYLPGYLREEKYAEGGRYLLAGILGLSPTPTAVLAAAGVVAACAWVLTRRPQPPRGAAALLGCLLLAVTPVQPWYAVTLLALACVAAAPAWSALAVAGYPYFFAVILDSPRAVAIGRASYGLALVVVAAASGVARATRRRERSGGRAGGGPG